MKTSDFEYKLPPELIAQHPATRRDEARMLVLHRQADRLEHRRFCDLDAYIEAGDLIVINNTRVFPARIRGKKAGSGGQVELLFLEERETGVWDVLMKSRRRPKPGARILLGADEAAVLLEDGELGRAVVRVEARAGVMELLERLGEPPLPPYISRKGVPRGDLAEDRERYQTIYARQLGAVAAPTAGLHFTPEVFERLSRKGVRKAEVTLHVGIGTFRPVEVENAEEHRMEEERYIVPAETAEAIRETRARGKKVIAVGSTSVRTLESAAGPDGRVVASEGRTDLFIRPGYRFRVVDAMLTNFHLPRSTLIMMISAFAGRERVLRAYQEAVEQRYRFYSYGDCMLIL